jgi:phosphoglycolate phosphatase/pyrophosphatase PpaX
MIKHICFDLDGTLVDSKETILKSTKKALDSLNISYNIPENIFNNMIGMHFVDIFIKLNIEVNDFEKFISIYKSLYFEYMVDSILYPGVRETLDYLKKKDVKISLLTTKVQEQAEKIINHFKLSSLFDYIMGRRDGIAHKPSPEPLIIICREIIVPISETLIVGDTELDIQCGKDAGSKTCAVLYGYRTKEQIEKENPDFVISRIDELRRVLELDYE